MVLYRFLFAPVLLAVAVIVGSTGPDAHQPPRPAAAEARLEAQPAPASPLAAEASAAGARAHAAR